MFSSLRRHQPGHLILDHQHPAHQHNMWWKRNSLSFPSFPSFSPMRGELISLSGNSVPLLGKHNSLFSPQFPPNFPRVSPISQWYLLIPPDSLVYCAVFNITSQVYIVSEHYAYFMHITCIFENEDSTLCETKNYKSGEFQRNSGEFWGNQTRSISFVFTRFPRCEIHFPLAEI